MRRRSDERWRARPELVRLPPGECVLSRIHRERAVHETVREREEIVYDRIGRIGLLRLALGVSFVGLRRHRGQGRQERAP